MRSIRAVMRPRSSSCNALCTACSVAGSIEAVASSRMRMSGLRARRAQRLSNCRSPVDQVGPAIQQARLVAVLQLRHKPVAAASCAAVSTTARVNPG